MKLSKEISAILKSPKSNQKEIGRLKKMLDEKQEKGILRKQTYDLPSINDVERHFYQMQASGESNEKCSC